MFSLHFSLRCTKSLGSLLLGSASLLLAGCGIGVGANDIVQTNTPSVEMTGVVHGGQSPIIGATIAVYEFGTSGYGSTATLKASTTTDANGLFSFSSGAYTCTQSNTPMYILSIGGNTGGGSNNPNAVLGAALGGCTQAKQSTLVLNEVTTVALAYALSHYFNTTFGGVAPANDSFGGPTTSGGTVYSKGLVLDNSYMAGLLAVNQSGLPTAASGNLITEDKKVYTIANVLAGCVNSTGVTGSTDTTSPCARLFSSTAYTPAAGGTTLTATDTLQAAVLLCLHPVLASATSTKLYNVSGTTPPFNYQYSAAPTDWSLAVSFTGGGLGLSVDTNTLSTIDIDSSNRIWFPSTASGAVGIAYFDPTTQSFSSVYNTTSMVHPNQVAIDNNGYAWVSDTQGTNISAYNTASPATATPFTLANTKSYSLTIGPDSSIRTGLYDSTLGKYRLGTIPAPALTSTYSEMATPALLANYIPTSMSLDNAGNLEFTQFYSTTPRFYHSLLTSTSTYTSNLDTAADLAGQNFWTGTYLGGIRTFNNGSGSGDGLCFTTSGAGTCYSVKSPSYSVYTGASGAVVDGAKTIWVANSLTSTVSQALLYTSTAYNQTVGSAQQVATNFYTHNTANGGTLPAPEGIAVDNGGNIWVSNASCSTTGCTPSSFVLSVLVGAAAPTVTPLAAQTVSGASLAGTQPAY